ncbi:MAG: hypothetical protein RIM72_11635 [Alphaproteobacteria bacterium]
MTTASDTDTSPMDALFGQLPEKDLKKLAAKIELDRTENKYGLPHQAIISLMRPYLAAARAPRVYTPQRILCLPFEDLLVFTDTDPKLVAAISRASIANMWTWVTGELMVNAFPPLADRYIEAQKDGDDVLARECASEIWSAAAEAMLPPIEEAEASQDSWTALAAKVGGSRRLEDIREMARVLRIADEVEDCKEALAPRPIVYLSKDDVTSIQRYYQKIENNYPGQELYLLLVMMKRLYQPFPILKVFRALSRKGDDTLMRTTDLSIAGNMVISALEQDGLAVAELAQKPDVKEDELVRKAGRFAAAFKGITTDIGIRRDGEWGQRMYKARNDVSAVIQRYVLNKAEKVIMSALPVKRGRIAPLLDSFPNEEDFERAEERAEALANTMRIADQIGLASACLATINELKKQLSSLGSQMLESMPKIDPDMEETATAHLHTLVRLMELVDSSDEADLLRRRGKASLSHTTVD